MASWCPNAASHQVDELDPEVIDVDALGDDEAEIERQLQPAAHEDQPGNGLLPERWNRADADIGLPAGGMACASGRRAASAASRIRKAQKSTIRAGIARAGPADGRTSPKRDRAPAGSCILPRAARTRFVLRHCVLARAVVRLASSHGAIRSEIICGGESTMSSGIESVLQENRVFPPSEAFVKQANISGMAAYKAMCAEAESDFEGFWAQACARGTAVAQAVHEDARRIERAVLQVVPRRRTERVVQLPRPASRDAARQGRDHLRGRRRHDHPHHLQGALSRRLPLRERAEGARASRRATASSSTCRCRSRPSWRCRRARASAPRTRWCSAASRRRASRNASSTPARSRSSPPTGSSAAAARFR